MNPIVFVAGATKDHMLWIRPPLQGLVAPYSIAWEIGKSYYIEVVNPEGKIIMGRELKVVE